eukprot:scaffold2243_cov97-Skeletonema_marinoi.AAC.1
MSADGHDDPQKIKDRGRRCGSLLLRHQVLASAILPTSRAYALRHFRNFQQATKVVIALTPAATQIPNSVQCFVGLDQPESMPPIGEKILSYYAQQQLPEVPIKTKLIAIMTKTTTRRNRCASFCAALMLSSATP